MCRWWWWCHCSGVYQLNVSDEDRDVWKLYVQIGKKKGDGKLFDTALAYCKVGVRPTIQG